MSRDFNGTTDRVDWAAVTDLTGDPITVSLWFYADAFSAYDHFLVIHASGDAASRITLSNVNVGGLPQFLRTGTTSLYRYGRIGQLSTGVWTHILATHNGTSFNDATTIHIYKDGTEVANYDGAQNGATESTANGSWSVGSRIFDDTRTFDGKIAEVAVWDVVLSTGTISQLASGRVATAFPTNLQFYWSGRENDLFADPPDSTGTADGTTFDTSHPITNFQSTLSKTLDNVSFSSSGTVENPPTTGRTATLDKTLDGITFSSVAANANLADLSKTIANITLSSSGTVSEVGYQIDDIVLEWLEASTATLDKTLGNATLSSSVKVATDSDLSKTLESITNVSNGSGAIDSSTDKSLGNDTFDSEVDVAIVGNSSSTLADATLSSSGVVGASILTATLNVTLDSIANVSNATNAIDGSSGETLEIDTFDAEADVSIYGNLSNILSGISFTSTGIIGLHLTGTLDVTLAAVTLIATGIVTPLPISTFLPKLKYNVLYYDRHFEVSEYNRKSRIEKDATYKLEDTEG